MRKALPGYLGGALIGILLGALAMMWPELQTGTWLAEDNWLARNLGASVWLFALVLVFYSAGLLRLSELVSASAPLRKVVQLDQLSDIWIHVFVGIGVVWTAIGMRAALSTTLASPEVLVEGSGEVLQRLVNGGILLALTTTIVGAIGGYLMRLVKTILMGAALADYYHLDEQSQMHAAMVQLTRIEAHLDSLSPATATVSNPVVDATVIEKDRTDAQTTA